MSLAAVVRTHIERHQARGALDFVVRVGIEIAAFALAIRLIFSPFIASQDQSTPDPRSMVFVLIVGLAAPLAETFLLQGIPFEMARLLKWAPRSAFCLSFILFLGCHFVGGVGSGLSAGFVGGLYLALTYFHWAHRSRCMALAVTFGTHATANALILILFFLHESAITLSLEGLFYV